MAELGIASLAPLKAWCRAWREGGAEALRPRPKGRPRGSGPEAAPKTREQGLEERVRRLEAEVAYLKKLRALRGGVGPTNWEKSQAVGALSGRFALADLLVLASILFSTNALSPIVPPHTRRIRHRSCAGFGQSPPPLSSPPSDTSFRR